MLEVKTKIKAEYKRLGVALVLEFKAKDKTNKMRAKKVKSEVKNEEIVMNKLGLNWAKLSLSWGLKLEFEAEV